MVFTVHFGQRLDLTGIVRSFTDFGSRGVDLFFLISGYLAGKAFYNNPDISIKEYYKKRIVTILPLYYLVVIYYFISENILNQFFNVIPYDELGVGWFRYIFILNGFLNSETYFWSNLGITWTIPIFCFFYLIAPWLLRKTKTLFSVTFVWIAVFLCSKVLGNFYSCKIFSNIHILFFGAVLYVCAYQKLHLQSIVAFLVAGICCMVIGNKEYLLLFLFACIILASAMIDVQEIPCRIKKIIDVLDMYSYTLYLMHGVIFCSLIDRLNSFGIPKIIIAICSIVGTIVATWIVGKHIEKPFQAYLKKRFFKQIES